jgi:hypothetical protein
MLNTFTERLAFGIWLLVTPLDGSTLLAHQSLMSLKMSQALFGILMVV